jgi:hypothetical protein
MGKIRYRCVGNVEDNVRAEIKRVIKGFSKISKVKHDIYVLIYDKAKLEDNNVRYWGRFNYPSKNGNLVVMQIAGKPETNDARRFYIEGGEKRYYKARCVGQTILHELVHYERYRDKKGQKEETVNTRAVTLYNRIDRLQKSR